MIQLLQTRLDARLGVFSLVVDGAKAGFCRLRRRRECGAADKLHFAAIPTHPVKLCLANDYKD